MAAVLGRVVDAQLYNPAVERAHPLQLGCCQAHLGEACIQRFDHVLSRHRSRRCVRVLRHKYRAAERRTKAYMTLPMLVRDDLVL